MEITWTDVAWKNNNYNSRQLISFIISAVILLLILLIPMKAYEWHAQKETVITVELTKAKPEIEKQVTKAVEEIHIIPVEQKQKPLIKTTEKPKFIPTEIIHKEAKIITQKTKPSTPKLPSSAVILNVMEQKPWLNKLDKDFQVATDDADDFIFKQTVKPEQKQLEFIDKNSINQQIKIKDPIALKALKTTVGFLFAPVADKEKTQDSLSYCHLLGRMSVHCPTNNPLGN